MRSSKDGCSCASRKRVDRRAREETSGGDGKEGTALCFMCEVVQSSERADFFFFFPLVFTQKGRFGPVAWLCLL